MSDSGGTVDPDEPFVLDEEFRPYFSDEPLPSGGTVKLCIGCRATMNVTRVLDDAMPPYDPALWERFECEKCGVQDVRLRSPLSGRQPPQSGRSDD